METKPTRNYTKHRTMKQSRQIMEESANLDLSITEHDRMRRQHTVEASLQFHDADDIEDEVGDVSQEPSNHVGKSSHRNKDAVSDSRSNYTNETFDAITISKSAISMNIPAKKAIQNKAQVGNGLL